MTPRIGSAPGAAAAAALALTAALVSGCSGSTKAADGTPTATGSPSPTVSPSVSASPTPSAQQLASHAAYAAYVGTQADLAAVVNSTRSDTDPRLSRHAASTGVALLAASVDHFVANHFALHGANRVVSWRVLSFYPTSGNPTAITATACVDSSGARVYDVRTGKEQKALPGHQRTPGTVRVQLDRGVWKVVDATSDFSKTC